MPCPISFDRIQSLLSINCKKLLSFGLGFQSSFSLPFVTFSNANRLDVRMIMSPQMLQLPLFCWNYISSYSFHIHWNYVDIVCTTRNMVWFLLKLKVSCSFNINISYTMSIFSQTFFDLYNEVDDTYITSDLVFLF